MISYKELKDNMLSMKKIGFPAADEIADYLIEGHDKVNALEYEKAYLALIEQVKDKSHEEQVQFLMEHMRELRNIVDLFSATNDFYKFKDNNHDNEKLANILLYRYEHNISVLDDEDCCLTRDYLYEVIDQINDREVAEEAAAREKFIAEHPEEYKRQQEEETRHCQQLAEKIRENNKKYHLTNENFFDSFN